MREHRPSAFPGRLLTFLLTSSNGVLCADPVHSGHRGPGTYLTLPGRDPGTWATVTRCLHDTPTSGGGQIDVTGVALVEDEVEGPHHGGCVARALDTDLADRPLRAADPLCPRAFRDQVGLRDLSGGQAANRRATATADEGVRSGCAQGSYRCKVSSALEAAPAGGVLPFRTSRSRRAVSDRAMSRKARHATVTSQPGGPAAARLPRRSARMSASWTGVLGPRARREPADAASATRRYRRASSRSLAVGTL